MEILIDDADIVKIKTKMEQYPIDGVTTNPSILAKTNRNPYEVLKEIRTYIGRQRALHVQVVGQTVDEMIEEAKCITDALGKETYIKVPAIPTGFQTMRQLIHLGYRVTATAIYTPMQAVLSAKCGVSYVAPYINRIDNLGYNGIAIAKQIQDILDHQNMETKILAASFKNSQQVLELCQYGIQALTLAPEILDNLVINPSVDMAIQAFVKDFEKVAGQKQTMIF